jgi:hypothetical protein
LRGAVQNPNHANVVRHEPNREFALTEQGLRKYKKWYLKSVSWNPVSILSRFIYFYREV